MGTQRRSFYIVLLYGSIILCLQSTSVNADKVCRHCFYRDKFADMRTYGYARCILTRLDLTFWYTYLLLAVSYEILRMP